MPRIFKQSELIKMDIFQLREVEKDGKKVKEPIPNETITVWLKPLSADEKADCFSQTKRYESGVEIVDRSKMAMLAVSYCVKKVEGVFEDEERTKPWEVVIENGKLSKDSLSDLLNIGIAGELISMASNLIQGVPAIAVDGEGKRIENVSIQFGKKPEGYSPN